MGNWDLQTVCFLSILDNLSRLQVKIWKSSIKNNYRQNSIGETNIFQTDYTNNRMSKNYPIKVISNQTRFIKVPWKSPQNRFKTVWNSLFTEKMSYNLRILTLFISVNTSENLQKLSKVNQNVSKNLSKQRSFYSETLEQTLINIEKNTSKIMTFWFLIKKM